MRKMSSRLSTRDSTAPIRADTTLVIPSPMDARSPSTTTRIMAALLPIMAMAAPQITVAEAHRTNGTASPPQHYPTSPSHPTLNALISSSLGGAEAPVPDSLHLDPAIVAAQQEHGGPRIGDPGKRMLGAALGVRHPSLGPRVVNNMAEMQRAMSGLVVAD